MMMMMIFHELTDEFLSECTEWHALMHGIWTGIKNIKWAHLPKEARKEVEKEWHYFEAGQAIGWLLKIGFSILALKMGINVI